MTREEFRALVDRAAAGWADGDAAAVGDCFAEDVEYLDPFLDRFDRRADLLPLFEPPPGGHRATWHTSSATRRADEPGAPRAATDVTALERLGDRKVVAEVKRR